MEIRAAQASDRPWTAKLATTTTTPRRADHPPSPPPARAPAAKSTGPPARPRAPALRTMTRSGPEASVTLSIIPVGLLPAVPEVHEVDAAGHAEDQTDRREQRVRPGQPVHQVADPAPDGQPGQQRPGDGPCRAVPAPGVVGTGHGPRDSIHPWDREATPTGRGLCEKFHKVHYTERPKGPATFPRPALMRCSLHAGTLKAMGSAPEADVRLDRVKKRFGNVVAVDGVSLDIRRGEFFSLLGPSGCGKTTSLRMIGGFERPDEGRIELGGVDVAGLPPHKRDVNTVFQSYALFPHLNVFDNVAYGLRRKGVERDGIAGRVPRILELVDLPGFEGRRVNQLSGGQQQRVALARALVNEPRVLLLDEPLGALDLKLRKQMQLFLKGLQHEVGITFIYVTHDQEEAMTMSNGLAVIRSGRVDQVGGPQDVYEHPATEFVAGFLGASNLLPGSVEDRRGDLGVVTLSSGEKVRVPARALNGTGPHVKVGVRPEKIRILPGSELPEDADNSVRGRLRISTYVGVSSQYEVETPA